MLTEITDFSILDVTGNEALALYPTFHREFVQRKRNELLNPRFIGLSEIELPRNSLIHYMPTGDELGPGNSEPLISNYSEPVFLLFVDKFDPILSVGKTVQIEKRPLINAYRAGHYNYGWVRDISNVYNKEKVLIVKSYGLAFKLWNQRPTMFAGFERHYDRMSMLVNGVNAELERGNRQQFIKIELPMQMPGYNDLMINLGHYYESFDKNGLPRVQARVISKTKANGSYWLLDLMAYLLGDYQYSLFGKINRNPAVHVVFTFNSKALIIKLSTLREWMDGLFDKETLAKVEALSETEYDYTKPYKSISLGNQKRSNAAKRFYLILLNLTRGGISEKEIKEDVILKGATDEEANAQVAEGKDGASQSEVISQSKGREGTVRGETTTVEDHTDNGSLLDILAGREPSSKNTVDIGTGKNNEDSVEDPVLTQTEELDWTSDVDDELLEEEVVEEEETSLGVDVNATPEAGVERALEEKARQGTLTMAEHNHFMRKANRYKEIRMANGKTLEDFINIKPEELNTLIDDAKIEAKIDSIIDDTTLVSRSAVLKSNYVKKFLLRDTVKMIVAVQQGGVVLNDFKHEVIEDAVGSFDVFNFQLQDIDGDQSTQSIRIPKVNEKTSTFLVDGVKSHASLQRAEKPIRKINRKQVMLTSYYPNRILIERSPKVVNDYSLWIAKKVIARGKNTDIKFSRGNEYNKELNAPFVYSALSSRFRSFTKGDITLNFNFNKLVAEHPEFKKYSKPTEFLVGVKDGKPILIDSYGYLYVGDTSIGTIEEFLGLEASNSPLETVYMGVSGFSFPIAVVLCYYFGIDKLIEITGATTRSVPMGTRPKLDNDEYAIKLSDEYLVFNKREVVPTLIFSGLSRLTNIVNYSRSDLNTKGVWVGVVNDPKVQPKHFQEMKNLFDYFIDPIAREELKRLKYSVSFHYLLLDAVKLLETEFTRHEVEIEEQRIVGYERFSGHVYREMVKAVRAYRSKPKGRRNKIDLNPEAVIMSILEDTSINAVEEVNPVHQVKDQEEVTFGGTGGRKDISVTKGSRIQLNSYAGIISEAHKDSGKVGFVTALTSDPAIADYRGNIVKQKDKKISSTGYLSVTGNLAISPQRDD